jgi:hypothetical protein
VIIPYIVSSDKTATGDGSSVDYPIKKFLEPFSRDNV